MSGENPHKERRNEPPRPSKKKTLSEQELQELGFEPVSKEHMDKVFNSLVRTIS